MKALFNSLTTIALLLINLYKAQAAFCRKDGQVVPRKNHEVCTFSQHIESDCKSASSISFGIDAGINSFRATCNVKNHTITCSCREDLCNRVVNVKKLIEENLKGPADVSFCNNSDMIMADCIQLLKCLLANLKLRLKTHRVFDDHIESNISIDEVEGFPRNKHSRLKHSQKEDHHFFILLIILVMVAHIAIVVVLMIVLNCPKDKNQSSSEKSARLKGSPAEAYDEERIEAGKIVQFRC